MAIDTSTIAGFNEMSAEDKVTALLGMEMPDMSQFIPKSAYDKAKASFDKTASELAAMKKQAAASKTEEERAAEEAAAKMTDLQEKYDALLKSSTISEYTAKLMKQGYSADLASETATALYNGDMEKLFLNAEKFNSEREKQIKADVLKSTPKPGGNGGGKSEPAEIALAKSIGAAKAKATSVSESLHKYY